MFTWKKTAALALVCATVLVYGCGPKIKQVASKVHLRGQPNQVGINLENIDMNDECSSYMYVLPLESGCIAVGTNMHGDIVVASYDDSATLQWAVHQPIDGIASLSSVVELTDGYFITGHTMDYSVDNPDRILSTGYILKLGKDGEQMWMHHIAIDGVDEPVVVNGAVAVPDGIMVYGQVKHSAYSDYGFTKVFDQDGNELRGGVNQMGSYYDIDNTGTHLAYIGTNEYRDGPSPAFWNISYGGELINADHFFYHNRVAENTTNGVIRTFNNEYYIYHANLNGGGYIAMINKDVELAWDIVIKDGDSQISITAIDELDGKLVFVGSASREGWPMDKGLIGRINMDGSGFSCMYIEDDNICGFKDVKPCNGGVIAVGQALTQDGTRQGVLAQFSLVDYP